MHGEIKWSQTSGQLLTRAKFPLMQLLIVLPDRRRELTGFERAATESTTHGPNGDSYSIRLFIFKTIVETNSAGSIDGEYRPGAKEQ
jgi:hypothetical protein